MCNTSWLSSLFGLRTRAHIQKHSLFECCDVMRPESQHFSANLAQATSISNTSADAAVHTIHCATRSVHILQVESHDAWSKNLEATCRSDSLYCCHWLIHADQWECIFSTVLVHFSSDSIFGVGSDVAVVWVTTRLEEIGYSSSLIKDTLFIRILFQSFSSKLQ